MGIGCQRLTCWCGPRLPTFRPPRRPRPCSNPACAPQNPPFHYLPAPFPPPRPLDSSLRTALPPFWNLLPLPGHTAFGLVATYGSKPPLLHLLPLPPPTRTLRPRTPASHRQGGSQKPRLLRHISKRIRSRLGIAMEGRGHALACRPPLTPHERCFSEGDVRLAPSTPTPLRARRTPSVRVLPPASLLSENPGASLRRPCQKGRRTRARRVGRAVASSGWPPPRSNGSRIGPGRESGRAGSAQRGASAPP